MPRFDRKCRRRRLPFAVAWAVALLGGALGAEEQAPPSPPPDPRLVQREEQQLERLSPLSLGQLLELQVTVTSSQEKTTVREAPAAVYVVTAEQIRERGYSTLEDALSDLPGFDVVHVYGTWPDLVHQRGLPGNNQRTLLYVDGVLDNNIFEGAILGGSLRFPLANVKRIEVLSGPASALYGANAFNGVINVITKRGDEDPGRGLAATLVTWDRSLDSVGVGADGFVRGVWESDLLGRVTYSTAVNVLRGGGPRFGGVQSPDWGQRLSGGVPIGYSFSPLYDNSRISSWNVTGTVRVGGLRLTSENWVYHQGQGTFANGNQQVDTSQVTLPFAHQGSDWSFQENKLVAGWFATLGKGLTADTEVDFRHTVVLNPGSDIYPLNNINAGPAYLDAPSDLAIEDNWYREDNGLELKERLAWDPMPELGSKFGVEYYRQWVPYDYATRNPAGLRRSYDNLAGYLQQSLRPVKGLALIGGLRWDHHSIYGDSLMPRLGLVFTPDARLSAKLLFGAGFRGPTAWEVYSSTSRREPNPNLSPEKLNSVEAGLGYRFSKNYYVSATAYWNDLRGLIINDVHTTDVDPEHPGTTFNQNQNAGDAHIVGVEALFDVRLASTLNLYGNATFTHGYYTAIYSASASNLGSLRASFVSRDDGAQPLPDGSLPLSNVFPNIAPWKMNLGATLRPLAGLSVNLRLQYVSKRPTIATDPIPSAPGFALVHANVHLQDALAQGLFFNLAVRNLFDQQVFDPGIRNARGDYYPTLQPVERANLWLTSGYLF